MDSYTLSIYLMLILVLVLFIGFLYIINILFGHKVKQTTDQISNDTACRKINLEHRKKLLTDYFWSNHMRAAWIMLFLVFFIALGFAITTIWSMILSVILILITLFFLRFAIRSYKEFPNKAAAQLKKFEEAVYSTINSEISFKGDNIQVFADKDNAFSTDPDIFEFPTAITKITFPPGSKKAIITTRKLEFLILSREYFSICKNASTFNLLNPARAGIPKQCVEVPAKGGECHEHYYSQMRNVEYDDAKECIRIIYYDERDDTEFKCKKAAPNRKPAMKALQEKLRLTERQRLHKIDEHEKYEAIKNRRDKIETSNTDNSEDESKDTN